MEHTQHPATHSENEHRTRQAHSISTLEELQRAQLKIAKKQLFTSRIIAVLLLCFTIGIGVCVYTVTPKLNQMLTNLSEISQEINDQEPIDVESLNDTLQELKQILSPISGLFNSGN